MQIYKILSVLLDYPEDELYEHLPEIRAFVQQQGVVSESERIAITRFIDWMLGQSAIELQGFYVQNFDHNADNSLHLTHHLFGDDRGRGPALVDLGEFYKHTGWEATDSELPDYLPMILEYVSTLDEMGARVFLADAAKVITLVAGKLEEANSPYAPLLRIVEARSCLVQPSVAL